MLVVADTLLNYDLNETFLVQDSVLRALNQLPRYREQYDAGRNTLPFAVAKVIESTTLTQLFPFFA